MRYLGICPQNGFVYEGDHSFGNRVAIRPTLVPICFPESMEAASTGVEEANRFAKVVFREDSFDPITKIRRGRIYNTFNCSQPSEWYINDPLRTDLLPELIGHRFMQKTRLQTYQSDALIALRKKDAPKVAVLGKDPFTTLWRILDIETSVHSDQIVTLKSFRSFGEVPRLIKGQTPEECFAQLSEYLEMVENSANRLGANEVADRCRDGLSVVFGYLAKNPKLDLSKSIDKYMKNEQKERHDLVTHCGSVVARLHARGKPSVQAQYGVTGLREEHSQLALRCLYVVLTELGWASLD